MSPTASFLERLEEKVEQQLNSQRVGYLLGAGASYLDGKGYPLAGDLWDRIAAKIRDPERGEIQARLDGGADGIEQALDLLDDGGATEKAHRYLVTEAIAEEFRSIVPPLMSHQGFVQRIGRRDELNIPVFTLNYDGLVENAADAERVRVVDGFLGIESPFFEPQAFQEQYALSHRGPRKPQADWIRGVVHLYKLHGSLGWFDLSPNNVRNLGFLAQTPTGAKRVMVPPQRRKAIETTAPPYAALWSDLRRLLCHGPNMLNRLAVIGYGLRDEHVNAIIENALSRSNFTLLVFAHKLASAVFTRWSAKKNTVIVTQDQCALNAEIGPGHPNLWKFEELAGRV